MHCTPDTRILVQILNTCINYSNTTVFSTRTNFNWADEFCRSARCIVPRWVLSQWIISGWIVVQMSFDAFPLTTDPWRNGGVIIDWTLIECTDLAALKHRRSGWWHHRATARVASHLHKTSQNCTTWFECMHAIWVSSSVFGSCEAQLIIFNFSRFLVTVQAMDQ